MANLVAFAPVDVGSASDTGSVQHVSGLDLQGLCALVACCEISHNEATYPVDIGNDAGPVLEPCSGILELEPLILQQLPQQSTDPPVLAEDQECLRWAAYLATSTVQGAAAKHSLALSRPSLLL
jgi:hypothetical protein